MDCYYDIMTGVSAQSVTVAIVFVLFPTDCVIYRGIVPTIPLLIQQHVSKTEFEMIVSVDHRSSNVVITNPLVVR